MNLPERIIALTSLAALLVATIGIYISFEQLSQENKALHASNGYEIQRDARTLSEKLIADSGFVDVLLGKKEINDDFNRSVWIAINFYASVYRQHKAGGLSSQFSAEYKAEFCQFADRMPVRKSWKKLLSQGSLNELHLEMHDTWCPSN